MRGMRAAVGQRWPGGHRRRGWRGAAALAVAASSLLAGCSTLHQSLGTSDSPCYVALPTATAAVGEKGHFAGVRLLKVRSLPYQHLRSALHDAGLDSGRVCLVAFTGTFSSSAVSHPSTTTRRTQPEHQGRHRSSTELGTSSTPVPERSTYSSLCRVRERRNWGPPLATADWSCQVASIAREWQPRTWHSLVAGGADKTCLSSLRLLTWR